MPKESFFALDGMNIDYSTDVKFLKDGLPMQANLTLDFTELTQMYADSFDNVKISYRGSKADEIATDIEFVPQAGPVKTIDTTPRLIKMLKKTTIAKRINNLPETLATEARRSISAIVRSNKYFKKLDTALNLDPLHLLEIKGILRKVRR